MNVLNVTERETILGLLRLKWSVRQIERETGRRHETIARYGREAGLLPAKSRIEAKVPTDLDAPIEGALVPDSVASRSTAAPFQAFIRAEHAKNRNAAAIYQDLVEHHGCGRRVKMNPLPPR